MVFKPSYSIITVRDEKDVKCENTKIKLYIIKKTKSILKRAVAVQSFFI